MFSRSKGADRNDQAFVSQWYFMPCQYGYLKVGNVTKNNPKRKTSLSMRTPRLRGPIGIVLCLPLVDVHLIARSFFWSYTYFNPFFDVTNVLGYDVVYFNQ